MNAGNARVASGGNSVEIAANIERRMKARNGFHARRLTTAEASLIDLWDGM